VIPGELKHDFAGWREGEKRIHHKGTKDTVGKARLKKPNRRDRTAENAEIAETNGR
jgi:hypothetical protein